MAENENNTNENESAGANTPAPRPERGAGGWERDLLERLAFAALKEQRRTRRWGILFKSLVLIYLFVVLILFLPSQDGPSVSIGTHSSLVELEGVIAQDTVASADNIVSGLRSAFEDKKTAGIILRANSPGGSPVQAGYIYDEIMRLREKYPETPVYAVISDVCASACYYIASATDRVYANRASMVGSVGVLLDGFGYTGLMEKLGVERRLMTAGEHKGMLDPFSPLDETAVQHFQVMLEEVHEQFINAVKNGRGDRLVQDPEIFSGLIWTGDRAVELGLVDELASSGQVAREVIGSKKIVDYTPRRDVFQRLADEFGASISKHLLPDSHLR